MEDLICHCTEKQNKSKTKQSQTKQNPSFYGGSIWEHLALSCGLQYVRGNSLSFLHILDKALLDKAYTFLVLLDVVKFSETIYRKVTCCEYDAFLYIMSLHLLNNCKIYIISPNSQVSTWAIQDVQQLSSNHRANLSSALLDSHQRPFTCYPRPHPGGPSSLAAGVNLTTTSPHREGRKCFYKQSHTNTQSFQEQF